MPFFTSMIQEFEMYLTTERRYSVHTVSNYVFDLNQFGAFLDTTYQTDPATANMQALRSWIAHLIEDEFAATSVHRKISTLRAYYKFLQKRGVRADNPARSLPRPKKNQALPQFIEESAMQKLQAIDSTDHSFERNTEQLIVRLLYETGMRQSELLGLGDSDLDARLGQLKVIGKRSKTRYIPVSTELLVELQKYIDERKKQFGVTNPGTLLVTKSNKKITKSFVYRIVRMYLSDVTTAKKRSPHVLRHTFATHMLNNGADLNVIKEILGHSSLAATQVYTHNNIEKLKQVHTLLHPRNKS